MVSSFAYAAPQPISAIECTLGEADSEGRVGSIYFDLINHRINTRRMNEKHASFSTNDRSFHYSNKGLTLSGQGVQYHFGLRYVANVLLEKTDPYHGNFEGTVQLGDAFDSYQNPSTPEYDIGKYSAFRVTDCFEVP